MKKLVKNRISEVSKTLISKRRTDMKVKKLISIAVIVSFVTGLITPNPVYAGKTPYEWNIDRENTSMPKGNNQFASKSEVEIDLSSGSAGYSYPITVPEGKGIEPHVSLVYSSSQAYGELGVGWSLNGTSWIERSTKNGMPDYNDNDEFVYCRGGSQVELVKVGDGMYREKKENSFSKYEYSGDSWTITDTSGTKYYYGEDDSSRIDLLAFTQWDGCNSNTFRWYISESEDLDGNIIEYSYSGKEPAQEWYLFGHNIPNLSEISYVAGTRKILFEYEDMPGQVRFVGVKEPLCNTKKLKRIITKCNGEELKRYELIYTESADTGRILLEKIMLLDADSNLDPQVTSFEYTSFDGAIDYEGPVSVNVSAICEKENITDIFCPGKHTNYMHPSESYSNRQFMDVNNDGLPDIVTYNENTPNVLRFYRLEKDEDEDKYIYCFDSEKLVNPPTIMKGTGIDHYVHTSEDEDIEEINIGATQEILTVDIDGRLIHLKADHDRGGILKKINLSAPRHHLSYFEDQNDYIPDPELTLGVSGTEITVREQPRISQDPNDLPYHKEDPRLQYEEDSEGTNTQEEEIGENNNGFLDRLKENGLFGRITFNSIETEEESSGTGTSMAPSASPDGTNYTISHHSQYSDGFILQQTDINGDGIPDMLIPWYPRSDEDQLPVSGDDRFVKIHGNDSGYFYAFLGEHDRENGSSLSNTPIPWSAPGFMTKLNENGFGDSMGLGNHTTFSETFGTTGSYTGCADADMAGGEFNKSMVTYLDMNGDGLKDLCVAILGETRVYYNTGYGFLDIYQTYPIGTLTHLSGGYRGKSVYFAEDDGEHDRRDDIPDNINVDLDGDDDRHVPPDRYEDINKEVPAMLSMPLNNFTDVNGDGIVEIFKSYGEDAGIIGRLINNANLEEVTSVEHLSTEIPQIDVGDILGVDFDSIPAVNLTLSLLPRSPVWLKTYDLDHPLEEEDGRVQRDYTWTQSIDMNGDGLPDYVVGGFQEMFVYELSKASGNANQADLLLSVKNPAGAVTEIEWGTPLHSDSRVCSRPVVKTIKKWNGVNGESRTDERIDYTYSGGSWDPVEKEFTGFKQAFIRQEFDTTGGRMRKNRHIRFHTEDKYLRGRIKSERFYGTGGTKQEILNEWVVKELKVLGIKFPVLSAHEEQYYTTENPIPGRYKRTEYDYDNNYGNVTEIRELGRPEIPDDGYKIKTEYSRDSGYLDKWLVSLKTSETICPENSNDSNDELSHIEYVYDENGKITTETQIGNTGNISKNFAYSLDGNLASETDYNGNTTTYEYDDSGVFCTKIIKPNGNSIAREYTPEGLLLSETIPSGHKVLYIYDYFGRLTNEYENDNLIAEYVYTTEGRTGGDNKIETKKLSCLGEDSSGTMELVSTEYMDGFGRVYKTEKKYLGITDERTIIQTNLYDNGGRLIKTSIPKFDGEGNSDNTTFYYDIFDRTIKTEFAYDRTTTSEYQHNPISMDLIRTDTDPNRNRKVYHYDVFNNLVKVEERVVLRRTSSRRRHVGEAEGLEKLREWVKSRKTIKNRKKGLKDRSIKGLNPKNLNGKFKVGITTEDFTSRSDLIEDMFNSNPRDGINNISVPNDNFKGREDWDWDGDGIFGNRGTIPSTDNLLNRTDIPFQTTTPIEHIQDGNPAEGQPDISEIQDVMRKPVVHRPDTDTERGRIYDPRRETNPGDIREINPGEFMNHGDPSRTEQPFEDRFLGDNGFRRISPGHSRHERENIIYAQGESSTGGRGGVKVVTEYHYDQLGRLTRIEDAEGNIWTKEYNLLGRLVRETHPDKGATSYEYDHNGNCTLISADEDKELTSNEYDGLDRITKTIYTKLGEETITITYHYDNYGDIDIPITVSYDQQYTFGKGRLTYITQTKGVYGTDTYKKIFVYDLAGRITDNILLVNVPGITNPRTYHTQIEYNTDGSVRCVRYPDNFNTTAYYKYTLPGLVYQIDFTHSHDYTLGFEFTYNAHGKVEKVTQSSATPDDNFGLFGTTTTYTYDMVRSIIKNLNVTSFTNETIFDAVYGFDYNSNITSLTSTYPHGTYNWHFTYDGLNRLIQADEGDNTVAYYAYDKIGNMTERNGYWYQYDSDKPHAVKKITKFLPPDSVEFEYDNCGRLIKKKDNQNDNVLNYDAMGRLETYNNGSIDICRNWYDDEGVRIMKQSRENGEYYTTVYVGKDYEEEIDKDGNLKKAIRHLAPALGRLATIESDENNSVDLRVYHSDHLGSSSVVTNSRNAVVSETVYSPFGDVENKTGAGIDYKFNGKELDETDLYYYGARYYDPVLCRFISADPVEGKLTRPQTLNSYSYCINNPLKYIDPDGREFMQPYKEPEYCNLEDQSTIAKILRGIDDWIGLGARSCDPQNVADSMMPDPAVITTGASIAGKSLFKKILKKISDFFNGSADDGVKTTAETVERATKKTFDPDFFAMSKGDPKEAAEAAKKAEDAVKKAEDAARKAEDAAREKIDLQNDILDAQQRKDHAAQREAWDKLQRLYLDTEKTIHK